MKNQDEKKKIEKALIPRLKMMGYLLFLFSFITLSYHLTRTPPPSNPLNLPSEDETTATFLPADETDAYLLPTNPALYYFLTISFALSGASCLLLARRHLKKSK